MDQACSESPCPVPHDQRPLEEYRQLCSSWFFAWPSLTSAGLWRPLLISWLLSLPLTALISSGSWTLRHDPLRQVATAVVAAVLPALLLLSRQWLGWSYVNRRLIAERVEYEESGWYDGQVWEKPLAWRQQDLLVARHQVRPVLVRLRQALGLALLLLLSGAGLCQAL
ncbi:DUF1230 family protein [Synechococcus sp. BSF8S]|uniref:CGLD27 family protein n=1 Tax=Synechococcales TaxID=1890424 RepID=UPI001628C2EC|nr:MULTISPECIES: CGLD27 family protein [unclassified Synechococcus]MBC1260046.1 DUF1230 family protein [Synechococcus sp. BSF8S]MBC1263137.1 DUF1230 family protein [Synechococcus sp. BSA11S]